VRHLGQLTIPWVPSTVSLETGKNELSRSRGPVQTATEALNGATSGKRGLTPMWEGSFLSACHGPTEYNIH
jgi:hypothetical protein